MNNNILFVLDGDRNSIYQSNDNIDYKFENIILKYFKEEALELNFQVLDMHNIFYEDYKVNNKKFNFENDYHWNEYGHSLVAEEIIKFNFLIN